MTTTYELTSYLDRYGIDVQIWSQEHHEYAFFGRLDIYRTGDLIVSITCARNSFPVLASRLNVLAQDVLADLEKGRQQLPPDGDTGIQYFSTTGT